MEMQSLATLVVAYGFNQGGLARPFGLVGLAGDGNLDDFLLDGVLYELGFVMDV